MPNIKSAEKRVRSTERRAGVNHSTKSRVATLERSFKVLIKDGKKDEANVLLPKVTSAYDKAAKKGVYHKNKADQKKSRLTRSLNSLAS